MKRVLDRRIPLVLASLIGACLAVLLLLFAFRHERPPAPGTLGLDPGPERRLFAELSRRAPGAVLNVGVLKDRAGARVSVEFAYGANDGKPLTSLKERASLLVRGAFADPSVRQLSLSGYYAPALPFNHNRKDLTFTARLARGEGEPFSLEALKECRTAFPFRDDEATEKRLRETLYVSTHLKADRAATERRSTVSATGFGDALVRGEAGPSRKIALTFDDGPSPLYTEALLETLAALDVKATFFVVGHKCALRPWMARALALGGHELGNHSYHHVRLAALDGPDQVREIESAARAVRAAAGVETRFLRPPGGDCDARLAASARSAGCRLAFWSDNPCDMLYTAPWVTLLVNGHARPGNIVLLHTGSRAALAALPWLVRSLRARGYSFATLSGLLAQGPTGEPGPPEAPRAGERTQRR